MRRLLWLGVGLAVGALAVRAATKQARKLSPTGLAGTARKSAGGLADSVRTFVEDVRQGMADREAQIQAALVDPDAIPGPADASMNADVERGTYR
jgi:chromosome condensin MukBEF MukE localization factor